MTRVTAIYNPVAGGGRAGREWPSAEAALRRHFSDLTVRATRGPGDAVALAGEAARDGTDIVVVLGGDGTISEVVDGLLKAAQDGGKLPRLGIVPDGTGSDLARTLRLTGDVDAQVERIKLASWRRIDAGRLSFVAHDGTPAIRHFINIASLGVSGPTSRAVNEAKRGRRFGARLVFMYHTIRELIRYRFQEVTVTVDDQPAVVARIAVVAVANGRYFGGGMMVAPDAVPDDGIFDVVIFRAAGKFELIRNMNLLYTGDHLKLPVVTVLRGRRVRVEPVGAGPANVALIDVDGEAPGRIPITFEIVPGAIEVAL